MDADAVKWFGLLIGLVMVVSAGVLAIRQNTTSWQHVFIFALGGVLAGISSVQFSVDPNGAISATIGQVKQATQSAASASLEQENAIKSLSQRVDSLQQAISAQQDAINALHSSTGTSSAPQTAAVSQALMSSASTNQLLLNSLARSHVFTLRAQSFAVGKPPPDVALPAKSGP